MRSRILCLSSFFFCLLLLSCFFGCFVFLCVHFCLILGVPILSLNLGIVAVVVVFVVQFFFRWDHVAVCHVATNIATKHFVLTNNILQWTRLVLKLIIIKYLCIWHAEHIYWLNIIQNPYAFFHRVWLSLRLSLCSPPLFLSIVAYAGCADWLAFVPVYSVTISRTSSCWFFFIIIVSLSVIVKIKDHVCGYNICRMYEVLTIQLQYTCRWDEYGMGIRAWIEFKLQWK